MLLKRKKERQHLLDILDDRNAEIRELQNDVDMYRANQECLKTSLQEAHDEIKRTKEDTYHWLKKYMREQDKRK